MFTKILKYTDNKTVKKAFEKFIHECENILKQKPKLHTINGIYFVGKYFNGWLKKFIKEHTTIHPSMHTENVIILFFNRRKFLFCVKHFNMIENFVCSFIALT